MVSSSVDYRTSEGAFPVPSDRVDWSTHVYVLRGGAGLRFSISRNQGIEQRPQITRLRNAARRSLRRVVFLRDEEILTAFGRSTLFVYTFEVNGCRRLEGHCIFRVGDTVFAALIEGPQSSAIRAEQVLRHFVESMAPHTERDPR